jgi:arginyl-tRNA--protein-N-Asp/Glu arginylyltransferase
MAYLCWQEKRIKDFNLDNIERLYDKGFVMTRKGKGIMHMTRSARIKLADFKPSSENRRILRKNDNLSLWEKDLPIDSYDWRIGKMAKDFYTKKFGEKIMSANKIKEILTEPTKSNFNKLLEYRQSIYEFPVGFAIVLETDNIIHYSYPFYNLELSLRDLGLGMMTMAVMRAKEKNKRFLYLGSLQRPSDIYKIQFEGFEWFDGKKWDRNTSELKKILNKLDEK